MNNILSAEKDLEIKSLRDKIEKLESENIKLETLLREADPDATSDLVTDEEAICIKQIRRLKDQSELRELDLKEVQKLDILHKNLRMARGEDGRVKKKNKKRMSTEELLSIVND